MQCVGYDEWLFPDPRLAEKDAPLAFGGDLSVERLVVGYANGIFPWYGPNEPILWWCPDPRCVLRPSEVHIPKSLRRVVNSGCYTITIDTAFREVMESCARVPREGQDGTWIVPEIIDAYEQLNNLGLAHSVEAWDDGELVGGLYGVAIGQVFFGESMFFTLPDASKVAFVYLARLLARWDYQLIDCQQTTQHLLRFGAHEISRDSFLDMVEEYREGPVFDDAWTLPEAYHPLRDQPSRSAQ